MNSKDHTPNSPQLDQRSRTGENHVYELPSLQSVMDFDLADVLAAIDLSGCSPMETFPGNQEAVGDTSAVNAFRSLFVPLPEHYFAHAREFMSCYVNGNYQKSFGHISLYTWRDDPSGLLSLYLASAALAAYDLPLADDFLEAAFENGSFELGNWWFKSLYHTLLGDFQKADLALEKMLASPLNTQSRFLEAWGRERQHNARKSTYNA